MSKLSYALALPLAALGTFAWFSEGEAVTSKPSEVVTCEIVSEPFSGGVGLVAKATAKAPASGSYEFVVSKQGSAGISNTAQSGEFELGSGEDVVLSEVSLGLDAGSRYVAELSLTWNGGEASCKYPQDA